MKKQYIDIPYVKKTVSRIVYGTAIQSLMMGENKEELFDSVYHAGITTFDTARNYMMAEKCLGDWIERRNIRDKVVISSKCAHPSMFGKVRVNEKEIRKDFMRSSRYLKTDYIDIYMLHRDDDTVAVGEIIEVLNALHAEGKIGAFGGSNWTHQRIEAANEYAYKHKLIPFTVSSPNFGLASQLGDPWGGGCVTISGDDNSDARAWYRKNQMPVIAYSSLGRGLFSGRIKANDYENASAVMDKAAMKGYGYEENFKRLARCEELADVKGSSVSQIAMAWLFGQDINTLAVVSSSNIKNIQENIAALAIELSQEELLYLNLEAGVY